MRWTVPDTLDDGSLHARMRLDDNDFTQDYPLAAGTGGRCSSQGYVDEFFLTYNFPDASLRQCVSSASLGKRICDVKSLDCGYKGISSLSGVEKLTSLTSVYLCGNNGISDINPLGGLENTTSLFVCQTNVSNIEPIGNLKKLKSLWLSENKITNVSPLRGLTDLESLNLEFNQIRDVSPLASLTKLRWLNLGFNWHGNEYPTFTCDNIYSLSQTLGSAVVNDPQCRCDCHCGALTSWLSYYANNGASCSRACGYCPQLSPSKGTMGVMTD